VRGWLAWVKFDEGLDGYVWKYFFLAFLTSAFDWHLICTQYIGPSFHCVSVRVGLH